MSPLSRDRTGVALFSDRLVLARVSSGLRPRLVHKEVLTVAAAGADTASWQPALDTLAARVSAGVFAGTEVTVVISSFFVRYTLVPWTDALAGEDEQMAYARHCFVRVYGDQAEKWTLKLSDGAPGNARLACAADTALIGALGSVLAPLGRAYRSLQPHLMASFNRWRARIDNGPVWFVDAEPGLLSVAFLREGRWQSIRTVKVGPEWLRELPGVLTREEYLIDNSADCNEVLLFAPDAPEGLNLDAGTWRVKSLLPTLLPGMAAGVDAVFSVAVGV